jgi:uncharacterized OB-fold protein
MSDTSVHPFLGPTSGEEIPPQPFPDVDSEGFWAATNRGELAVCRCQQCRAWMHPPLERCRMCGDRTDFETVSGTGVIHSFIVMHRASVPGLSEAPYAIVLVDLDDAPGIRLTGILADAAPQDAAAGAAVQARIVDVPGGYFRAPEWVLINAATGPR